MYPQSLFLHWILELFMERPVHKHVRDRVPCIETESLERKLASGGFSCLGNSLGCALLLPGTCWGGEVIREVVQMQAYIYLDTLLIPVVNQLMWREFLAFVWRLLPLKRLVMVYILFPVPMVYLFHIHTRPRARALTYTRVWVCV